MVQTLEVRMVLKDEFTGAMRTARGTIQSTENALQSIGRQAVGTAGGFIAAQASIDGARKAFDATIGSAAKYEAQMAQIRALTGATKKDTDQLDDAIKDMTKTLPKSPAELGAGAYFILSSGISDVGEAAEVLEVSAKAATIGLGETATVADALTTVLNAYNFEADQAGRVTDILIQAVKDGKVEADGFAGVLGTVVPIAAQMGISFEEVAANLATFTRLGVDAETSATGLKGVMTQLLKPSDEARELLAGVGLSMQDIRDQVREKGLAVALMDLMDLFKGNEEAITTLFPDVRGLINVLGTAGVQSEAYTEILGNMETATGNLDRGFEEISETTKFKFEKAINDLNVSLMELGEVSLPFVSDALDALNVGLDASRMNWEALLWPIKNIPDPVKDAANALGDAVSGVTSLTDSVFGGSSSLDEYAEKQRASAEAVRSHADRLREAEPEIIATKFALMDMREGYRSSGDEAVKASDHLDRYTGKLETLQTEADEARKALFDMFKQPTQEQLDAEAGMADLELEASNLENRMGPLDQAAQDYARSLEEQGHSSEFAEARARGLTFEEAARWEQLQNNVIPTQQRHIDHLRIEREAMEANASATAANALTMGDYATQIEAARTKAMLLDDVLKSIQQKGVITADLQVRISQLIDDPILWQQLMGREKLPIEHFTTPFNLQPAPGMERGSMNVTINTQYPPTRGQVMDGVRDAQAEWNRAVLTGG